MYKIKKNSDCDIASTQKHCKAFFNTKHYQIFGCGKSILQNPKIFAESKMQIYK